MRSRVRTWTCGGIGLILCAVVGMLHSSLTGTPAAVALSVTTDAVYAASVLVLAIGGSREASVVARRPLGVVALTIVALWPLTATVVTRLLEAGSPTDGGWEVFWYLALVVPVGSGLIAAVQIARAGTVAHPWRWAPVWVLCAHALAAIVPQLLLLGIGPGELQLYAGALSGLGLLAFLSGTVGLGTLALVLAARQRPSVVDVFRSA